jgi:hypothetical protein
VHPPEPHRSAAQSRTPRECAARLEERGRILPRPAARTGLRFHYALGVRQKCPETRAHVRLLGPCFKTGREDSQYLLAADCLLTTLTKTSPPPRTGSRGPAREGRLYRQQGTLSSSNHTARPVAAGSASARPARLLRHGCAGKSLYNNRGADKSVAPRSVSQAYGRKDRRPDRLAHPHPVPQARVLTDKEATTRSRTTATRHPDRSRRPTKEAVRIPATSTTRRPHSMRGPRPQTREGKEGKQRPHRPGTRAAQTPRNPEIFPFELRQIHPFTPRRFHALLNSLFRVLFNFPSRYLFAIGLVVIFSLRRSLPPT